MIDLVKIGSRLALLRREKGFIGEKLAELLEVSPQAISKWENGKCVSFDYATPLYKAIGYTPVWANRLEKSDRKAERLAIMRDLQNGKPVLAINLRIAPEWE